MNSGDGKNDRIVTLEELRQRARLPDLDGLDVEEIKDEGELPPLMEDRISGWAEALLIGVLSSLIASAIWWMSSQSVFTAT